MNSATVELITIAASWREQKNRISLFFVKSVALFAVFLIVVIVGWKLCATKGDDTGTSETLKALAVARQIRSVLEREDSYERTIKDSTCVTEECTEDAHFLLEHIDQRHVKIGGHTPCNDFYNFTCGNNAGDTRLEKLQKSVSETIEGFIKNPIADDDTKYVKLQKKYYQSCMDLRAIEEDNNETFKRKLRRAGKWPLFDGDQWSESEFDWGKTMENCREEGLYFNMLLTVDGTKVINGTDDSISYALEVSPPFRLYRVESQLKKHYAELMAIVVKMLGAPGSVLDTYEEIRKVVNFEIDLINAIEETLSDTHFNKTMAEIEKDFPFIPWSSFLKDVKMKENTKILFNADVYLTELKELLERTSKRVLANYMLWKTIETAAPYLTSNIRREFEIYANRTYWYRFPVNRKEFCYKFANFMFSYISEAEYVSKHVVEKRAVKHMIDRLVSVLRRYYLRREYFWSADNDKKITQNKLESMNFVIGGPNEMFDVPKFAKHMGYDMFNISHLNNVLEIVCEVDRKRAVFGVDFFAPKYIVHQENFYKAVSRVDKLEYIASTNKLFVPTAAMQGFLFSTKRPNFLNYGVLGTIIGYQLARVIDEKDHFKHENRIVPVKKLTNCLLNTCYNISVRKKVQLDCNDSVDKMFADYMGVKVAREAYTELEREEGKEKSLPGLTYTSDQLFWISYASTMCSSILRSVRNMLPRQRIIGTLRNFDDFANDFQCPSGTVMNPRKKC